MSPETLPCSELLLKGLFFKLLPNIFYCVKTYDNLTKMMTPMKFSTLWSSSHLRGVSATKLLSAAAEIWSLHSELYDSFLHFMAEMLMIAIIRATLWSPGIDTISIQFRVPSDFHILPTDRQDIKRCERVGFRRMLIQTLCLTRRLCNLWVPWYIIWPERAHECLIFGRGWTHDYLICDFSVLLLIYSACEKVLN